MPLSSSPAVQFQTQLELAGYILDELYCHVTVKADLNYRPSPKFRGRYLMLVREGATTTFHAGCLNSEDVARKLFDLSRYGYQLHVTAGTLDLP